MNFTNTIQEWIGGKILKLLVWESDASSTPFCDFERVRFEIRPGDVLLIEGRSRISDVIKTITFSRWTHAALYIGRIDEIENEAASANVRKYYRGDRKDQLLIEALATQGTIISRLNKYQYHNLRICRPRDLSPQDVQKVVFYATRCVGMKYSTRQLLDLARFFFPYGVLPKRWRSSLFEKKIGTSTRIICSTMLAEAFASVQYPVLPFIQSVDGGKFHWFRRNSSLFVPTDFDYSPYFDVIKYPFFGDDLAIYKKLPWHSTGVIYNNEMEISQSKNIDKNSKPKDQKKDSQAPLSEKKEKNEGNSE